MNLSASCQIYIFLFSPWILSFCLDAFISFYLHVYESYYEQYFFFLLISCCSTAIILAFVSTLFFLHSSSKSLHWLFLRFSFFLSNTTGETGESEPSESDCHYGEGRVVVVVVVVVVRQVNVNHYGEGRVVIMINNIMGAACNDIWNTYSAQFDCRMLGYTYNAFM